MKVRSASRSRGMQMVPGADEAAGGGGGRAGTAGADKLWRNHVARRTTVAWSSCLLLGILGRR